MPVFSAVLNIFRGSPATSQQEGDTSKSRRTNVLSYNSPGKSPNLLQKLNRNENAVILNESGGFSAIQGSTCSKKRTRVYSSDDDEEKIVSSSQKRRRLNVSASDGKNQNSVVLCASNSKENQCKVAPDAQLSEKKTEAKNDGNKTMEGKYYNDILSNEKDVCDNKSSMVVNTNSEENVKVSTSKIAEDNASLKVNLLDVKTAGAERDMLMAVFGAQALSKKDAFGDQKEEKMDCSAVPFEESHETSVGDDNMLADQPTSCANNNINNSTSISHHDAASSASCSTATTIFEHDTNRPQSIVGGTNCNDYADILTASTSKNKSTGDCSMISHDRIDQSKSSVSTAIIGGDVMSLADPEQSTTSGSYYDDITPISTEISFESIQLTTSGESSMDSTTISHGPNQPTTSASYNNDTAAISHEHNQPTLVSDLNENEGRWKDTNRNDSRDNQLVPDIKFEHASKIDLENSSSGDQIVDENGNEKGMKRNEEEQEKVLLAKQISEGALTDSMLDQEKKLHEENMEEEKEIVSKAMDEWRMTAEQQRYSRLQHLLQKSNVYSTFLLQRIEEQKVVNEKKKLREAKKIEKAKKEDNEKESPQKVPDKKRPGSKKKNSTAYNITDYVDTEALKKSSKESVAVPVCVPDKDNQKTFSIGASMEANDGSQKETSGFIAPQLFTGGALRDYQIEGVQWLKVLYENGVNGILADEMGLGKTIQCIAVIAHLIEHGVRGPFLITAPLSTLPNWLSEFKRFAPGICTILYHGTPEERAVLRRKFSKRYGDKPLKSFPVAITSYDIIMRDSKHLVKYMWKYLIVDEGHRIKNLKCKLIRELKAFPTANRLLLTGTPLQNNLSELWSLLNFLLPDIFNDLDSFQAWFDFSAISESGGNEKIIAQEREHHVLERLHEILTPFLLRRLKSDVSIDIPRKKEVFVYAPLTQKQKYWYQLLLDKTGLIKHLKSEKTTTPSFTSSGRKRRSCSSRINYKVFDDDNISYEEFVQTLAEEDERKRESEPTVFTPLTCERNVKVLSVMMQLRKACNHPYLLEYPLDPETQDYRIDEEVISSCGKTLVLDQMLAELTRRGHKILLFSQMTKMLDILEDFCYVRKYKFSRIDGSMKFEDRQIQIEDFNSCADVPIFLLSTRAGGLGLNLTAADTVIIYDSDWNPQQDLQAQDRCHRIGQTKPVVVYRILTANTIDQRIVERAREKRTLEKLVIHKERFKGRRDDKKLSASELKELLQSSDHMTAVNSEDISHNRVLSSEQLDKLLDRSDLLSDATTLLDNNDDEDKLFKVIGIAE